MIFIGYRYFRFGIVCLKKKSGAVRQFLYRTVRYVMGLKDNNKIICFQLNTTIFYYLTYWLQVSAIRPSSGHLYIKFKTGYM